MSRLFLLCLTAFLYACSSVKAPERPNFIYILVDDFGYGDLNLGVEGTGAFRNPHIQTPRLAEFAQEAIVFTDHYSSSPVCSPSRAGLLTGRIPLRANVYLWISDLGDNDKHFMSGKEIIIPELLQEAGYTTAVIGKWHLNGADWEVKENWTGWTGSFPKQQGFDYALVSKENPHETRQLRQNTQDDPGDYFDGDGNPLGTVAGWTSQLLTDYAIEWLKEKRDKSKPFFLYLPFDAVHEKIENPEAYTAMYDTGDTNHELYYGNVTHLDNAIGRFLDAVRDMGLDENTVVFFSSDNGPEVLNSHHGSPRSYGTAWPYHGQKIQLFEGSVRVPGMIRWPGKIRPRVSNEPNSTLDVLPTICELAGATPPNGRLIDGVSLVGHLLNEEPVRRQAPLYWQFDRIENWVTTGEEYQRRYDGARKIDDPSPAAMVRSGPYVLRGYRSGEPYTTPDRFELYNIVEDRLEQNELSSAEPETFAALVNVMKTIHAEVDRDRRERLAEIQQRVDQRH